MSEQDGLVCAYLLDGAGGGQALDWHGVRDARGRGALLWVHLNRKAPEARRWVMEESGFDALVRLALLAEETRPRCERFADGVIVNLRGINFNPGADPADMVAVRLWVDSQVVVSVRGRRLMGIDDIRAGIAAGDGPKNPGDLIVQLAANLVERMSSVLAGLDDQLDELEAAAVRANDHGPQARLSAIRREAIGLRRYVAPQREAISRLAAEDVSWLDSLDRMRLREVGDRISRYVEDLDAARERAAVVQDDLANRLARAMDRTMYTLAIVAAVFLPLEFLTELFGVTPGGVLGTNTPWAFATLCAILLIIAAAELWLFRRLKWI
jgi:zinc transporter